MPELVDIIAPIAPPPVPTNYVWLIFAIVVCLLILLAGIFWQRQRTRTHRLALKKLQRTERALHAGKLSTRRAAFEIGAALNINGRHAIPETPSQDSAAAANEWAEFRAALDASRYAAPEPNTQQTAQLLAQARHWIARTPC